MIDFSKNFINRHNNEVLTEDNGKGKSTILTLGSLCISALLAPTEKKKTETLESQLKRDILAEKISTCTEPFHLVSEEIQTLKKDILDAFSAHPSLIRQSYEMIEPIVQQVIASE